MYVQKLLNTIQDQQVQINNMGEEKAFPSKQTEEPSDVCTRKDCLAARDEVKRLTENVQLLEFQVKAHKDDWEAERNEKREVIKHRDDTKAQLVETVRELHALRVRTTMLFLKGVILRIGNLD
ncbi:hypothetical protein AAG570_003166 [Ranatra chinensis]|uniref:Uncharacterized protein n=1 Tax=Ranatra chinensis TaxID=642074 RepID=A0ABD0Y5Z2_9HEMI